VALLPPLFPIRDRLPTRLFPFVNYALIAANIAVFILQITDAMNRGDLRGGLEPGMWALVPARFSHDPIFGLETVFTSMFLHASWSHVLGNMFFLWIFGDNVEDAMGHVRYLVFYLLGGVCAAALQTLANPASVIPMVGASGAISAVLAAYGFLYPRSSITVINPIFLLWFFFGLFLHLPAWLVIGEYFLVNLSDALMNNAQGGVAFMAHVGGFVGGAFLLRLFMAGRTRMDDYARWQRLAERREQQSSLW
jgi:membrane associated rhomboid family serine protease